MLIFLDAEINPGGPKSWSLEEGQTDVFLHTLSQFQPPEGLLPWCPGKVILHLWKPLQNSQEAVGFGQWEASPRSYVHVRSPSCCWWKYTISNSGLRLCMNSFGPQRLGIWILRFWAVDNPETHGEGWWLGGRNISKQPLWPGVLSLLGESTIKKEYIKSRTLSCLYSKCCISKLTEGV